MGRRASQSRWWLKRFSSGRARRHSPRVAAQRQLPRRGRARRVVSSRTQGGSAAVVLVHQGQGLTRESYEEAVQRVTGGKSQLESPADWPVEGLLVHAAGEAAGGFASSMSGSRRRRRAGSERRSARSWASWASRPNRTCARRTRSSPPDSSVSHDGAVGRRPRSLSTGCARTSPSSACAVPAWISASRPREPRFRSRPPRASLGRSTAASSSGPPWRAARSGR
jgi:hypothetical protein